MALQTKTVQTGDYAWKSWSNGYVIALTLTEESVNISANTSLVKYHFTISNTNNNRFTDNNNTWTIAIGGQEIAIRSFNFNLSQDYTTQTIASGQLTVTHNADGSLQLPYSVSVPNIQSWNRYGPPAMSLTGTWELTEIPRASTLSCPAGIIGQTVSVAIQKANDSFTHTVSYTFGSLQGVIAEKTAASSLTWSIPAAFYTQIPDTKRGAGTLTCKTYSGATLVGESTCQFYADIDEELCYPEITARVVDVNPQTVALTDDVNTLIRYYSHAYATAEFTPQNSATLADTAIHHNGTTYAAREVTVSGAEAGVFTFTATDSRGLRTTLKTDNPLIPYVKLTCSLANTKPDGQGNMTLSVSGNYYAGGFGAAENTLQVQYRYKQSGESWQDSLHPWQDAPYTIAEDTYTAQTELTGLDYRQAYTFQARALDKLATAQSGEYTARAIPVFDWGEEDFAIHGDLSVDGRVLVDNTPVLNTPFVQTCCWSVEGAVTLQSLQQHLPDGYDSCAFVAMVQGTAEPLTGVAVGSVCRGGQYGAGVLYDYVHGAQPFRLVGGELQTV